MPSRRPAAVSPGPWARAALSVVLVAVALALAPAETSTAQAVPGGTAVTTSDLNLRVGYRTSSRVKLVMPEGATVTIVNRSRNGYWKVVYDGVRGYAHGDYLDFSGGGSDGGGSSGTARTTSDLNLRSRASASSRVLLVMPEGASVELTGQSSNGFLGVVYRGTAGWASADYLDTGGGGGDGGGDGGGSSGTARTTTDLNLRSRASAGSSVLLVMPEGATVELTGQSSNGFLGVIYRGTAGWASAQYLDTGGGGDGGGGGGASTIILPVTAGGWEVIQGYNGGTHQGVYQSALDLARDGGGTAGSEVISPVTGTVVWSDPGSGGILIDMGNGHGVAMFHVTFDGSLGRGSRVTQGQWIGTISGPGGNGYAATPHVEIDVWTIEGGRSSVAFTGRFALAGNELPNDGTWNQYLGTVFYP